MTLLETTHAMLEQAVAAGISLREIAGEGSTVNYEWLKKYFHNHKNGEAHDPSVSRIQSLHDRLSELRKFQA